jgi:hypothetical protein
MINPSFLDTYQNPPPPLALPLIAPAAKNNTYPLPEDRYGRLLA